MAVFSGPPTAEKWFCLSGDSKPTTGVTHGATLYEYDTGKTYLFIPKDKTQQPFNGSWVEMIQMYRLPIDGGTNFN